MSKTNLLAIEAIKKQIQKFAFDANLFDRGIANYPYAEKSSKKRKELLKVISELEEQNDTVSR
jgi:hypothetical protein